MRVAVTIESTFVVEIESHSEENAKRAVEANWGSIYKHWARWLDGTPPQLQGGKIVSTRILK